MKTGANTYSAAIAEALNYIQWQIEPFLPYLRGRILEVGIGHGSFAPKLRQHGDYMGIDIDAVSVTDARARYPEARFAVCDILDATSLKAILPDGADAIVSANVLEHIDDDRRALGNLVEILRPGGHLMLNVPALMLLYNDLDRLAGHHRRYTKDRLRYLLNDQPIAIERLCYFNPVGGLGWWLNSMKRYESLNCGSVNGQIRFFDKYVVPVSRALDPLCRSWFGQSVICVGRRI
jgi:SAM-dependent methyltransferase